MDGKLTVSMKALWMAVAVAVGLLALVVAYLLGSTGGATGATGGTASSPVGQAGSEQPSISMAGRGQATVVPDQLTFGLSVSAKDADLDQALDQSSTTMKAVLAALTDYGVTAKDVTTTGLQMNPEYDYPNYGPPVLTGYRVTQQARVVVPDLTKAGKAISAAVATGGNGVSVHSIRLGVSDPDAALATAREAAMDEAKTKAEQYADASGEQLGEVLRIREVSAPRRTLDEPLYYRAAAADLAGTKAVPIRAGEKDLTVRLQVVWSLEPAAE